MLYHKQSGVWTDDPNKPTGTSFRSIWGANSTEVFMLGGGPNWVFSIWRKAGNSWIAQTLPSFPDYFELNHVWGLDTNHVFATGYLDLGADSNPDHGILLYFDGTSWTSVQVPADCRELRSIHGTSFSDLWASGITTSGKGVVYRITNNLATWTPYVNQDVVHYQPIFSARAGTALAIGGIAPAGAGNLRVTTIDQVNQPATSAVDNKAYGPGVDVWYNAGKAWFVSISDNAGKYPSGVYSGDCN
jgi:hypothetical protein